MTLCQQKCAWKRSLQLAIQTLFHVSPTCFHCFQPLVFRAWRELCVRVCVCACVCGGASCARACLCVNLLRKGAVCLQGTSRSLSTFPRQQRGNVAQLQAKRARLEASRVAYLHTSLGDAPVTGQWCGCDASSVKQAVFWVNDPRTTLQCCGSVCALYSISVLSVRSRHLSRVCPPPPDRVRPQMALGCPWIRWRLDSVLFLAGNGWWFSLQATLNFPDPGKSRFFLFCLLSQSVFSASVSVHDMQAFAGQKVLSVSSILSRH